MKCLRQTIVLLLGLIIAGPIAAADKGTIHFGLNNWPENIAVSNMWKILLENRGYDVKLTMSGKSLIYSGIASDSLDVAVEVWLPLTDLHFYKRYKSKITIHDAWYWGTALGLVVPSYVEIDTIPELRENRKRFTGGAGPTITGIDPGSALMGLTSKAIEAYGLNMNLLASSSPAMMAALERAYEDKEPIVVTLWKPHWAFARYDLKFLEDPKGIYGQGENIHWMSSPEFTIRYPMVVDWLNNWDMTDQQIGSLMATVREAGNPVKGAKKWIENHREVVEGWFEPAFG